MAKYFRWIGDSLVPLNVLKLLEAVSHFWSDPQQVVKGYFWSL